MDRATLRPHYLQNAANAEAGNESPLEDQEEDDLAKTTMARLPNRATKGTVRTTGAGKTATIAFDTSAGQCELSQGQPSLQFCARMPCRYSAKEWPSNDALRQAR